MAQQIVGIAHQVTVENGLPTGDVLAETRVSMIGATAGQWKSPRFSLPVVTLPDRAPAAGYVFTAVGRQAYVEVAVPNAYAPETSVLPDLAPAIAANVPVITG